MTEQRDDVGRAAERELDETGIASVGDGEAAGGVDDDRLGAGERDAGDGHHGRGVRQSDGGVQVDLDDAVVIRVGDVEIVGGIDREALGAGERGAEAGERECGGRATVFEVDADDLVRACIGDVEVAIAVEREPGGLKQRDAGGGDGCRANRREGSCRWWRCWAKRR